MYLFLRQHIKKILFTSIILGSFFSLLVYAEGNTIVLQSAPVASVKVGEKLYIISSDAGTVSVLNTKTNTLEKTIPVGPKPISATVVGTKIYVNNSESTFISVIDTTSDAVKTTVNAGAGPISSILVGTNLYVNSFDNIIGVVNTATDILSKTIPLSSISGGAVAPSMTFLSNRLYLQHTSNNSISVIDTTKNTVIQNFTTGTAPLGSVRIGNLLYVVNSKSNNLTITDVNTYEPYFPNGLAGIPTGNAPSSVISFAEKLYVNNVDGGSISVIDKTKNTAQTIPVGNQPTFMLAETPYLYILNTADDSVSIINSQSDKVIKTLPVGDEPVSATIVGKILYVNNRAGKSISKINTTSPTLVSFSSETPDGTYAEGSKIKIAALFDQNLGANSTMTVVFNNGKEVSLASMDSMTLRGEYTIQGGDDVADLSIKSIKNAKIIGLFGLDATSYTIPAGKNLGDLKNIVIKTSGLSDTAGGTCKPYRLCPTTSPLQNMSEYRENLVCEGFISQTQAQTDKRRISRLEILQTAVNMLRTEKSPYTKYQQSYTDIIVSPDNHEIISMFQTALEHGLITPSGEDFGPTKSMTRIEAYAVLMAGVCLTPPSEGESDIARTIHQLAVQEGITSKPWARFRAKDIITRSEVFILVSRLTDWADKTGGCQALACAK